MTDRRDATQAEVAQSVLVERLPTATAAISRRMVIRGAYAAVPTILTLNSKTAAAWAIASGTIGVPAEPTGGDALCLLNPDLDTTGLKAGQYRLPPNPDFVHITSQYEYSSGGEPMTAEEICAEGGSPVGYRPVGSTDDVAYTPAQTGLPPGVLVSNSATASLGGAVGSYPHPF